AQGQSLRFHHRDRSQYASTCCRTRERGIYSCGKAKICSDRGLRRAGDKYAAQNSCSTGPAHENRRRVDRNPSPLLGPFPKYRATHTNMRRAKRNRCGKIGAHAHRQQFQTIAFRDLGGEREMGSGSFVKGRNAHKPRYSQPKLIATSREKAVSVLWKTGGFY